MYLGRGIMQQSSSEQVWLGFVIEPTKDGEILSINISKERNILFASERFLSNLLKEYGQHSISTDGSTRYLP
jgi:putative transposase